MNILILQPYRPDIPWALLLRARQLLIALLEVHSEHTFDVVRAPGIADNPGPETYAPHAVVRNQFIETYLCPEHTDVLWVDVDLIDYPADIVRRLDAIRGGGIAAPAILCEGSKMFYDIGGFIEDGRPFTWQPPYTQQPGPVVDLDSVGCLYLIPAAVYRAGLRYAPTGPGYGVEHYSVCQGAKERLGLPVRADLSIVATHARLSKYRRPINWETI
jgi:hypothetical protein